MGGVGPKAKTDRSDEKHTNIGLLIRPGQELHTLMISERDKIEKEVGVFLSWPQVLQSLLKRAGVVKD